MFKTSSLFDLFPPETDTDTDTAFLDRMHCYIWGWEIPKFKPEHFSNDYGFITDYLAEFIRELRKEQFGDVLDRYFHLGKNLNQRGTIAVRKMVGVFCLESQILLDNGKFERTGIGTDGDYKGASNTTFSYLKANGKCISVPLVLQ